MKTSFLSADLYRAHPVAKLQPQMRPEQYAALLKELADTGQPEPVLLYQGHILYPDHLALARALADLGRLIGYKLCQGSIHGLLTPYLDSTRRPLFHVQTSKESRVAWFLLAAAKHEDIRAYLDDLRSKARGRMKSGVEQDGDGSTSAAIAERCGCSPRLVGRVMTLQKQYPALLPRVASGDLSVGQAIRLGTAGNVAGPLPVGKFRVVYADPPWEYNVSGNVTGPGDHYPMMTTPNICAMPVASMAADDAVLFLWTTSSRLEDAFDVVARVGFPLRDILRLVEALARPADDVHL